MNKIKSLIFVVALLATFSMIGMAALTTTPNRPMTGLNLKSEILKSDKTETAVQSPEKLQQNDLLLTFNPYKPSPKTNFATTELKINLENFDMEYVLKVQ